MAFKTSQSELVVCSRRGVDSFVYPAKEATQLQVLPLMTKKKTILLLNLARENDHTGHLQLLLL